MSDDKVSVTRVKTAGGSRIDPPLNQSWSELEQLRWWAAIAEMDSGIPVTIYPADSSAGRYDYSVPGSSGGQMSGLVMRGFLLGFATGGTCAREEASH